MKASNFLLAVIGAAAAGVVVGLLIAPDKGSETRRLIGKKAEDIKSKASDLIKTGKEYVSDLKGSMRHESQSFEPAPAEN